jgi:hypothetical protein
MCRAGVPEEVGLISERVVLYFCFAISLRVEILFPLDAETPKDLLLTLTQGQGAA